MPAEQLRFYQAGVLRAFSRFWSERESGAEEKTAVPWWGGTCLFRQVWRRFCLTKGFCAV